MDGSLNRKLIALIQVVKLAKERGLVMEQSIEIKECPFCRAKDFTEAKARFVSPA